MSVYAELGTDLLNVSMLADPELLVSSVAENADIERGKDITIALIKAMVTCWIDEKRSA